MSVTALAITVLWNLQNRWHTDQVAKRIRGENFSLDEWKSQRAELLRALRSVENKFAELNLLSLSAFKPADLKKKIADTGKELTRKHILLQQELERVDASWVQYAYGADHQGESDWDCIHSVLGDIASSNDAAQIAAYVARILTHGRGVSASVNQQVRVRTAEHDPIKY